MDITTKSIPDLRTLLATARESATAIEAELKRREAEEAEKARKRVRPLEIGMDGHKTDPRLRPCYNVNADGYKNYFPDPRTARVHAYAECMAKVAEDGNKTPAETNYSWPCALAWCADMIADRPSTPERIQAARDAGFID